MLGLGTSLVKGGMAGRQYVKDGLKLYMPYRGADTTKGVQFVGEGSTSFDGSGDYIAVDDIPVSTSLTISVWVYATAAGFIVNNGVDADNNFMIMAYNSGRVEAIVERGGTSYPLKSNDVSTLWSFNKWHHIAIVYNIDNSMTMYIDGVDDSGATSTSYGLGNQTGNMIIGGRFNSPVDTTFTGSMKNCAIWNRALTATEVQNVMYKTYAELSGRLADNLVSWWALESNYLDSTSNDNDGTASGDPTQNADVYGGDTPVIPRAIDNAPTVQADAIGSGSAALDGSTDYISVADDSSLDITSDFSITCWVKFDSFDSAVDGIMHKGDPPSGDGYGLYANNGDSKVKFFSENYNSDYAETGALSVNTWYHIAGTYSDSGNLNSIYVDGVLIDTSAETTAMVADNEPLEIGRIFQDNGYNLNGNLCQVGIWSRTLSQETIQSVMEKTYEELTASEKTDLVSWYPLDAVTNLAAGAGNVKDSHGSNHGTVA